MSIILPFRNSADHLGYALASIEQQTFDSWFVYLIDDGSADGASDIAASFNLRWPQRSKMLKSNGIGAAAARNLAIRIATTQYVAFLDSDDAWCPTKLEVQIAAMQQSGGAFSYTAFRKMDSASRISGTIHRAPFSISSKDLLSGNPIRCSSVVYDQFRLGPVLMPEIRMRNDMLTWIDVLRRIEASGGTRELLDGATLPICSGGVVAISEPLCLYRQHSASLTGNKLRAAIYQWRAYREYLRLPLLSSIGYFIRYAFKGLFHYVGK